MVAELLLKRTTAAAAARTYEPFLEKYPSVNSLAQATEEELAQDFKSIGLYAQRAKASTKLAQHLIEQEAGSIPSTLDGLSKAPGLGSYSAPGCVIVWVWQTRRSSGRQRSTSINASLSE